MNKILLVDDDYHLANLTQMALSKNGYEVAVLHEGFNIIEDVKKYKPDLIIMDFMLPKMSGGDAVKLLRKDANLKNIPVIFLTGLISGDENSKEMGVNVEGVNYRSLGKPYEIDQLIEFVRHALNQKKR